MTANDEFDMDTRDGRLANNEAVMRGEDATEDEVFYNQIETRLGLPEELQTAADRRLGDAYVNSLAQHEARGEYTTWAPLSVSHLVNHDGVTPDEASAIVAMTAMEYGTYSEGDLRTKLIEFFNHLTTNTDTFDRVLVEIERAHGEDHKLDDDLIENLVDEFLKPI